MSNGNYGIVVTVWVIFGFIIGAIVGSQLAAELAAANGKPQPWAWFLCGCAGAVASGILGQPDVEQAARRYRDGR